MRYHSKLVKMSDMNEKKQILGPCPHCGEGIVERENFYGCRGWQDGCDFAISKAALASLGHPVLSPKQMRKLLKSPLQLRFKMADGTEKLFWVELKKIEGKWRPWIDFDKGSESEAVGYCPRCGADVVETPLSFGCSRWQEGCDFAIFKNAVKRFGGKMLSKNRVAELLQKGRTSVEIRGFDGKMRQVPLILDPEYGCKIVFKEGEEA